MPIMPRVTVRLSEDDIAAINEVAAELGVTQAEAVRILIRDSLYEPEPEELPKRQAPAAQSDPWFSEPTIGYPPPKK